MRRGIGRLLAPVGDNRRRRSVRWASADDRVRQRSTETHHGWRRSTPAKKQLEVYAARVYVAEDEGGYIWLNLSMLSQDKATRVVRVPVGLLVDADGQQNGDRGTDLANHGVVVPAAAAAPASTGVALRWRCKHGHQHHRVSPDDRGMRMSTNSSRRFLGGQRCTVGAGGVQVVRAGSFSRRHHRCSVGGVVDREPHCAVVVGVPGETGEASEDRGDS